MSNFDPRTYWHERHARQFGPESVGYVGLGVPFNVWMYRVRKDVVTRAIRRARINLRDFDVLDVGSGTGFYIDLWTKLGARYISGSDFAPYAVNALRARFPGIRIHELDITTEELPPELGSYDLVSAFDILYHIVDDERYGRAFRNLRALLRPNGYLVFSENFLLSDRETSGHQVSRCRTEIERVLDDHGFEAVHCAPLFFLMNRPLKSRNRALAAIWHVIERVTGKRDLPMLGEVLGAALYPIELATLRMVRSGPTTELMICRRRD